MSERKRMGDSVAAMQRERERREEKRRASFVQLFV